MAIIESDIQDNQALIRSSGGALLRPEFTVNAQSVILAMQEQKQIRTALIAFMREEMAHGRDYYYMSDMRRGAALEDEDTMSSPAQTRRKDDEKPILTRDGALNVCAIFQCFMDEPRLEETQYPDGHYACKATVRLVNMSGALGPVGVGFCTTREIRYASRWIREYAIPKGLDKSALETRTRGGRTVYRITNPELNEAHNTVLQMAIIRGLRKATWQLPGVPQVFEYSDAVEAQERQVDPELDAARSEVKALFEHLPRGKARQRAAQLLFGGIERVQDLATLDVERLDSGAQQLKAALDARINWDSKTLDADLKALRAQRGKKAIEELFDAPPAPAEPWSRRHPREETIPLAPQQAPAPPTWRSELQTTLEKLPPSEEYGDFRTACGTAMADLTTPDAKGQELLSAAVDFLAAQDEEV